MKAPPMQPVHHAKGNFDMTKDEFRRIEKAMSKPEFAGMLNDYMLEISDPKNKDEYDEYLKQLQKEGDLPKELKLVKPQAGFCIKTTITSKRDKNQSQKLFINCCHTPIVQIPSFDVVERDGKQGQNWKLPYSAGKMRYDQTKDKEVCTTIDVAFHPYTFQLIHMNPRFQELVCQTALDAANLQMGERNEIISKDYKVLKNMKCKGGDPALLTVRVSGNTGDHINQMKEKMGYQQQQQPGEQSEMQRRQNGEGYEPTLYKEIINQKKEYTEEQAKKREEQRRIEEAQEVIQEDVEAIDGKSQPIQAPKYKIVYQYPVNYEDFLDRREEIQLKRPISFTVEISLPRANNISEIALDIEEKNLVLNVKEKYFLDIKLPYSVFPDDGNASFDKKKKVLKIKLPIDKSKLPLDPTPPKPFKQFESSEENQQQEEEEDQVSNKENANGVQNQRSNSENQVLSEIKQSDNNLIQNENQKVQQSEPLLEIKSKNLVQLNVLNQQTKEQFLEDQIQVENPVIEVISENKNQEKSEQEVDEDDVEEDENFEEGEEKPLKQKKNKQLEISQPVVLKTTSIVSFKIQQTADKTFLIFNIPQYDKLNIKTIIFDGKVFICYEDKKTIKYNRVDISQQFKADKSTISLVTDYIVINLEKEQETFWQDSDIASANDDYETFKMLFDEMSEAKKLYDESVKQDQKKIDEEIKLEKQAPEQQNKMDDLDGLDGDDQSQEQNQQNQKQQEEQKNEKQQLELDNKDDTQVIKISEEGISKNVLQFIEFNNIPFVYELD
ncbi:pre-RNA processing PIH1/Nop17 protein (macronuclear) [Tetrahymena thermophila SB210]|uniref:Protein kintoun n=1 Tax=Tetrahymena thermophila (strain SB210) TaxID=312017 RepID=I7M0T7_TETTS|nr:pre-RNA processing PIH1/Nop17 protein [Tetrahymena thermophila SB210]EAR90920.1 pre-RNA processing PIH1/Nop17 protein [Tetrahymena thermophila SB210]|eukprot:XP_001011165.1 pre-RNA processing PIH1/Nop17 protein [Tetrahymena thermophila SB210]